VRRLGGVVCLLAAVAFGGCGADERAGTSTIAKPVAPAPLPTETAPPADNAVEPPVGGGGAVDDRPAETERQPPSGSAARRSHGRILSAADRLSFMRLAGSLSGAEGLAVSAIGADQGVERIGSVRTAVAWSTSKVPVAMAVIARGAASSQEANLRAAITESNNEAAMRLWGSLGSGTTAARAADEQLRDAGDAHTNIEYRNLRGSAYTPFGQTQWSLADQARFTAGMTCTQAGAQVLGLMNDVVVSQRWGLGAAGVEAQFKPGWGPGWQPGVNGGYLDRQMGVVTIDGKPVAVAIASRPADGSHVTGTRSLTALARWLVEHANVDRLPEQPDC
jgi:hypothetical protein